ncbi:MAG: hypothetical protein LZF86_110324 [Nitrospira sp.]|nr:MAG: hypothetical protein LZF86_110324 [Nitrospira sp.]
MYPAKSFSLFADQERVTLPVEDPGDVDEGGVAGGEVVGVGVTTGADGCSKLANPGLIWASLDIEGARLAAGRPDCAAAVNGDAAAAFRDAVGATTLLSDDIESGLVVIGTIGAIVRSPVGAGMLFDGLSVPFWGVAGKRVPAEESLGLVCGEGIGSGGRGALTTAEVGFLVNLW